MTDSSFLPEDYLAQKTERRTNLVCLTLFAIVMLGVFAAFWITNRQWKEIKVDQTVVNARYEEAGQRIEELTQLEQQKQDMLDKAELAASLVERVPRSVLLAELINRMPARLSLVEFELHSLKVKAMKDPVARGATGSLRGRKPSRAPTKLQANAALSKIQPTIYKVTIMMVGVAPTDLEVSRYLAELNAYPLLDEVTLEYSEETDFEGQIMREFKIFMDLVRDADVREIDQLIIPRGVKDPMTDTMHIGSDPTGGGSGVQPSTRTADKTRGRSGD